MAEKVTVAQLDLDTTKLVENAVKTKKALEDLRVEQAKLKKGGEQSTEQFVKNEVAMKKLSTTYNEQKKVIGSLNKEGEESLKVNEAINKATEKNIVSIDQARKSNKELLALRNKLDISTDAGKKKLDELNSKLDSNNQFIKENVSGYEEQKIEIGGYTGALEKFFPKLTAATEGLKAQKTALVASTAGTTGLTKASKLLKFALISTGIGAIAVLFGALAQAISSSESATNKLNKILAVSKGVMNGLLNAVRPLANFLLDAFENPQEAITKLGEIIKTNLLNRLEGLLEYIPAMGKAITQVFSGEFSAAAKTATNAMAKVVLGVEDVTGKVGEFSDGIKENVKDTVALTVAQANLVKAQRNSRKLQLDFQKDAEKQRQIRDDEALSINERIAANVKLGQILKEQSKQELEVANEALRVANLRIKVEGDSTENLDARAEALTEISDIEERITGQQSEQLVNINSLRRDQAALEAEDKKRKEEQQEEELERINEFEQQKRELLNEIALQNAATEEEKNVLKQEQQLEQDILDLENLQLTEERKAEIIKLLESNTLGAIAEIRRNAREEEKKEDEKTLKEKTKLEADLLKVKELAFNKTLGLIGEETKAGKALLLAKKIIAAKEALIGLKQLTFQKTKAVATATTAIATGTAQSASIGFPQNIISLIGFAAQVGGIISAIKSVGSVSAPSFADGGQIPTLRSGMINNGSNLSTPLSNGDDTLAYVRQGEVILNAEQQARAGGSAFFSRIGVPNFADGGMVGMSDVSTSTVATGSNNAQEFATIVAAEINKVKVVAIEQDITDAQITKATIIDGASI